MDKLDQNQKLDQSIEKEQLDTTNPEALREAARLGTIDTFLVKSDLEDVDQRESEDGDDGRPSPLANADNPEK
ncbi:hypothetical protein GAO09_28565 [Rhizobiales bacterium RZME27]|jgi:hypothetical protein|uniref:Uncharacterized protein n=1 Tax=Endobacterium cereale TaxID=2663029 RepID=A0A6A8AJE0_9HYPH|nr:hypothetical protein [Endobacterium cereale]MEB2845843.1 hypothetical protein [Endobacterium cereale]MQY49987.1 hypothetical protein [Endobacterium cereale]